MSEPITACCKCPEHQSPRVNDAGWVLVGLPEDPETWEAFQKWEWEQHCANEPARRKRRAA